MLKNLLNPVGNTKARTDFQGSCFTKDFQVLNDDNTRIIIIFLLGWWVCQEACV